MKHLKRINEDIVDFDQEEGKIDIDVDLVKDIIIELKDEYNHLEGGIYLHSDSLEIRLNCRNLRFGESKSKLEYIKNKFKFIELLLSICERLEDALNVNVSIHNIYDDFEDPTKPWIYIWLKK